MDSKTAVIQWISTLSAPILDARYRKELAKAVRNAYEEQDSELQKLRNLAVVNGWTFEEEK
jgi:hypothetical protein